MPSWDLFLSLFFVVGVGYGLVLQRDRSVTTLLSTYVALVISQTWAGPISDFLNGNKALFKIYISGKVSPFAITAALFVLFIVLVAQKSGLKSGRASSLSSFEILVYSFFSTALIISTVLSFMPSAELNNMLVQSRLATLLIQYHNLFLLLPPILVIIFGVRRGE